jgi:hypothetical protein
MNKNLRKMKVLEVIDTLNDLHVGISKDLRFKYRLERDSIFVNGLSDDLAHLYLLLHSGVANVSVFLSWHEKGMELEIMVLA